jgi:RNA polymerase sigma-70 factor (ECF subfamily)
VFQLNAPPDVILSEPELKALMLRSLDGDAVAYRRLLEQLGERLNAYFTARLRADPAHAEDLLHDTLMAIHAKRVTFGRGQPVTPWAYAIARYKLVDHYRRSGRRRFVPIDDDHDLFVDDESAAADARHDLSRRFRKLAARLRGQGEGA